MSEKMETQVASNQNPVKADKFKRASQSPVTKNRSKMSIKGGVKQMKTMKAKLESKSKKIQKGLFFSYKNIFRKVRSCRVFNKLL